MSEKKSRRWPDEKVGYSNPKAPTDNWKPYHVEVASGGSCRIYAPDRDWLRWEIVEAHKNELTFLPLLMQNQGGRIVVIYIRPGQIVMIGEELPDFDSSQGPMIMPPEALDALAQGTKQ